MVKRLLKAFLQRRPRLYRILKQAYSLLLMRVRLVMLSGNSLPETSLAEIEKDTHYNGIIDDLIAYTGFSRKELAPYLLRHPSKHFQSEFEWFNPKTETELRWFYRCSAAYLFGNATHPYSPVLDIISKGRVLDLGAGAGCNTIGMAKRGLDVDFLEINPLQANFIVFRAQRHKLKNVRYILPYSEGTFDPVSCITEKYDAIVAMDVLEHIPNYHILVNHLIGSLNREGLIIENSPFDPNAEDIAIHIRPSVPIEEAMVGMEKLGRGLWRKKS